MSNKITILFIFTNIYLFSQNNLLNEAKYWVWRDRLVNDWMVPNYTGDYAHKGRGIVLNSRGDGWWQDINYARWNPDSNMLVPIEVTSYSGGFDINDEGFQMGKYLIVLSTEWRLLFNSGLPTKQTEAEIYWALKTIDRLDYDAETYWSYFWSRGNEIWGGQRDGFMIRDDVFNLNFNKNETIDELAESKQTLNSNNIQLLPNPTNDILVLQSNETENYSVEIYDIMGQLIAKTNINANENISVGHLKRGLYIFKIFNQNELVQIQKIVLQ